MVKVSVKEGWSNQSKMAILGLIGGLLAILVVIIID